MPLLEIVRNFVYIENRHRKFGIAALTDHSLVNYDHIFSNTVVNFVGILPSSLKTVSLLYLV